MLMQNYKSWDIMCKSSFFSSVRDYERLTGETVEVDKFTEQFCGNYFKPDTKSYLKILPSGEFLIWEIQEKEGFRYLWLGQTYAKSFSAFVPFVRHVMAVNELEWIATATQRNPRAHIKKWGMERLPEHDYCFEGRFYYVLKGHISNLK